MGDRHYQAALACFPSSNIFQQGHGCFSCGGATALPLLATG